MSIDNHPDDLFRGLRFSQPKIEASQEAPYVAQKPDAPDETKEPAEEPLLTLAEQGGGRRREPKSESERNEEGDRDRHRLIDAIGESDQDRDEREGDILVTRDTVESLKNALVDRLFSRPSDEEIAEKPTEAQTEEFMGRVREVETAGGRFEGYIPTTLAESAWISYHGVKIRDELHYIIDYIVYPVIHIGLTTWYQVFKAKSDLTTRANAVRAALRETPDY